MSINKNKRKGESLNSPLRSKKQGFKTVLPKREQNRRKLETSDIPSNSNIVNISSPIELSNSKFDRLPVRAGVPQGSILGPILYNIFTSDLPDLPPGCQKSLFADDTGLSAKGRSLRVICSRLQKSLDIFSTYLQKWKISPNASESFLFETFQQTYCHYEWGSN